MSKKIIVATALILMGLNIFATTYTINASGVSFSPDSITVMEGDTVVFQIGASHDAQEVSQITWDIDDSAPLVGGFYIPFGGGELTGLTTGTHYYVCTSHIGSGMKGKIVVQPAQPTVFIPNVWINEIHYDNNGSDTLEGYEIAGTAGTDLSCYRVFLYNGLDSLVYRTDILTGTIPNQACGFGTVWFSLPVNGFQNGSPDGIVLEYAPSALSCSANHVDTILQFLSYEGVFAAKDGRASGLVSTDITVSENGTQAIGQSLQLGGVATNYAQFTWQNSQNSTYGNVNTNQFFCGLPSAEYRFNTSAISYSENAGAVIAGYVKAANVFGQAQTINVVLKTGNASDINNYTTQTLTFSPGGTDSLPLNINITDDALVEGTENLSFVLRNASHNGVIGVDSLLTLTITDNDTALNPVLQFITVSSTVAENAGSFLIPVSITNSNSSATSVDVNVLGGGTATPFTDFSFSPLTLTFPANSSTNQMITVTLNDDVAVEGNEFFTFRLNFPTNNATVGVNAEHTVTITDNDNQVIGFSVATQSVNESTGTAVIPVQLTSTSTNTTSVTVQLQSVGTTATAGLDFEFQDTTLTWSPGTQGIHTIPITILNDALYEPTERIKLKLINPTNNATLTNDTFVLSIINDDTLASGNCTDLFFSEYIEGSSSNKLLEIYNPTNSTVDLSNYSLFKSVNGGTSTGNFGLSGQLASGDVFIIAHSGADSLIRLIADTVSGFVDFNGNDALALVHSGDTLDVIGEIGINPGTAWNAGSGSTANHTLIRNFYTYKGETDWSIAASQWNAFPIDMFDSLGAHHTAPCGTLPPQPKAIINFERITDTELESAGTISVVVKTENPSAGTVSFFVARDANASTAIPGSDYIYTNQNLVVTDSGTTIDTVYIDILDDLLIEPSETVLLRFINLPANAEAGEDSIYLLNIIDDDQLTVSFNGAGFSYIEKDTNVLVRITLSSPVPDTTKVSVQLASGSATPGTDFAFTDTTLVFPPNTNDTLGVWVTIFDDNNEEVNEQINFNLINPTNGAILGVSAYTMTIIDNDSTVGIAVVNINDRVLLSPNPAKNTLLIETIEDLKQVFIIDLLGVTVATHRNISEGRNLIDISSLSEGMYFLSLADETRFLNKRFVVIK